MIYNFIVKNILLNIIFFLLIILLVLFELKNFLQKKNSLNIEKVIELINHKNAIIIDLRDLTSFKNGHILNSINIPYQKNENYIDKIKKYKNKIIIFVHYNNKLASDNIKILKNKKFDNIFYIKDGIDGWIKNDLPVYKIGGKNEN